MIDFEIAVALEARGHAARRAILLEAKAPSRRPREPEPERLASAGRQTAARRLRRYIRMFEEQEGLCFYCRQPMELPHAGNSTSPLPPNRITSEHLFPGNHRQRRQSKYVVAACHACNQERGSHYHWRDFMIRKIEQYWAPR